VFAALFAPEPEAEPPDDRPKDWRAALDDWFCEESVGAADWRAVGQRLWVLKGAGQGYWLRVTDAPGASPFAAAEDLRAAAEVDADDAERLGIADDPRVGQLAQIVCKRMAWRLPGFANASVGYLHRNFLSMPAEIAASDERVEVRLGAAPLGLMLNLTGMSRQRYRLADGRLVVLSQGEGA
jgi:hypothetical protein